MLQLENINQLEITNRSKYFDYSSKEYGVALKYELETCSKLSRGYFLEMELNRFELDLNSSENAKMVVEVKDREGNSNFYTWFLLNEVPSKQQGEWINYSYQVSLPKCKTDDNKLLVYIRNEDKANFLISEFNVRLFDLY